MHTDVSRMPLRPSDFKRLQRFGTCPVSNAIEKFKVRLRYEGYMRGTVSCYTPELPPMLGYAATGIVHTTDHPVAEDFYHTKMEWWRYVETIPEPRVLVLQDADHHPGGGALAGELHAAIGRALRCTGVVTNGAVRDVPQLQEMRFHVFAGSLIVAHAYAHVAKYGEPVEVGGLRVAPGDLIHGDLHGVHTIPLEIGPELIAATEEILRREREFVEFCRSPEFSMPELSRRLDKAFRDDVD